MSGAVPAIANALKNASMRLQDMTLIELNEVFAAQFLSVLRELSEEHGCPVEDILLHTHVNSGAIALSHPLGASGGRITISLLYEMKRRNSQYGLASLCIRGGMRVAIILKNL